MKICPSCGAENENEAIRCSLCGEDIASVEIIDLDDDDLDIGVQPNPITTKHIVIAGAVVAVLLSLLVGGIVSLRNRKQKEQNLIARIPESLSDGFIAIANGSWIVVRELVKKVFSLF